MSIKGVLTITLPDNGGPCVPIFTTPVRAADYARTQLRRGPVVEFLTASAAELAEFLRDLKRAGIDRIALDRCPRCPVFAVATVKESVTADSVLELRCVYKATEIARAELYFAYALNAARLGKTEVARDVMLEAAGHVTLENLKFHLLLGELAIALNDPRLLDEAKMFLRFLGASQWDVKLDQDFRAGVPDLSCFSESPAATPD